ncbi:GNAT family N-acetyltransferase [Kribbella capetownensis]|uniref:GNAT family N-acetyltransferase n=1 Tax=Kribbella capetownensis TaxID=1572659 RepID=A0A4R0JI55_9ACTN|nr:GNAT family N-acetyltransferase [Kribbella capetownensis]TCC46651.1 GNAT family N-acetyltransferase [Kribbella capetownensis]
MPIPDKHPVLTDGVVTLRAPLPDDVQGQIDRQREEPGRGFTGEDARRWIGFGITDAWTSRDRLVFIVEYQGRYAGTAALKPDSDGNARLHYGLSEWARGAGVASRAVRLLLEFGFTTCEFRVVHWWASVGNWPSRRVAWATGFRLGETIPGLVEQGGRPIDAWTGWIGRDDARSPRRPWFDHPVLETPRLRLRTWRQDELPRITAARTNEPTAHFLPFIPQPFTADDARLWLRSLAEQAASGIRYNWCIADSDSDVGLGNLTLFNIYRDAVGDGEIGYWAHADAQGRGVMTEAIERMARWYFAPENEGGLGGRKLLIRTAATNKAARRVAEKSGFHLAGTERDAFPLASGLDDRVTYDRLVADRSG